jgi:NAD-dependent dihydropyrimidine dehydrogenase PreA subunit
MPFTVTVKPSKCENKQDCVDVCPTNVFDLVKPAGIANPFVRLKIRVHGGLIASAAREEDCTGCMACIPACPESAITVTPA